MERFTYEDGAFYCNHEQPNEAPHNVVVLINGLSTVEYDYEWGILKHKHTDTSEPRKIFLSCKNCGRLEDVTDVVNLQTMEYGMLSLYPIK